jgi:hypothetical protein
MCGLGPLETRCVIGEGGERLSWEQCLNVIVVGTEQGRGWVRSALSEAGLALRELTDLPTSPGDAALVCVCLDHPDQFDPGNVVALLGSLGMARLMCVRGEWCASLLRSRTTWPPSVAVRLDELPARLALELEVIAGRRPPLPLTAGLEEVAAFVSAAGPTSPFVPRLSVFFLLAMLLFAGCGREPQRAVSRSSWPEQVASVREQGKKSIVATEVVDGARLRDLLTGCRHLEVLEIDQARVRGDEWRVLLELPQLRRLRVGPALTDADAAVVGQHPAITELLVSSSELTDAGVASLCQLPLVQFRLHAPHATDAAMTSIGGRSNLRFLHLVQVPLTDAGLAPLAELKSLESLYLDGTRCTDEGLSELLKKRPDIHFHRDQAHLPGDPKKDGH